MLKMHYTMKTIMTACAALVITASSTSFALETSSEDIDINAYTCKDVMRMSGGNRDMSISFIHGYWMGKAGKTSFNKKQVEEMTNKFYDYCLDNPKEKAVKSMGKFEK